MTLERSELIKIHSHLWFIPEYRRNVVTQKYGLQEDYLGVLLNRVEYVLCNRVKYVVCNRAYYILSNGAEYILCNRVEYLGGLHNLENTCYLNSVIQCLKPWSSYDSNLTLTICPFGQLISVKMVTITIVFQPVISDHDHKTSIF